VANVKQKRQRNLEELYRDIQSGHVTFEEEGGSERERSRSIQAVLKVLEDTVGGLLRVVELFEARKPKGTGHRDGAGRAGCQHRDEGAAARGAQLSGEDGRDAFSLTLTAGEVPGADIVDAEGNVIAPAGEPIVEKQFRKMKRCEPLAAGRGDRRGLRVRRAAGEGFWNGG